MADTIQGIRSLRLHELIGATLTAIVQADAQAAQSTLEFIETVGFIPPTSEGESPRLRMAEFRYEKLDENNEIAPFVVSVPLLSLVPIPGLQVKEAELAFSAKITDIAVEKPQTGATAPPNLATGALAANLLPTRVNLFAKPVASSGAKDQEVRGTFHLDIKVSLQQADIPLGVEKVFDLMDQAIRDRKENGAQ
jgi:hypothetical protein